jgi:hypothetical protein
MNMEQLSFEKAFELADAVARLLQLEKQKKELNEDINAKIKFTKRDIANLSNDLQAERRQVAA